MNIRLCSCVDHAVEDRRLACGGRVGWTDDARSLFSLIGNVALVSLIAAT
jgi:hypothetical protein